MFVGSGVVVVVTYVVFVGLGVFLAPEFVGPGVVLGPGLLGPGVCWGLLFCLGPVFFLGPVFVGPRVCFWPCAWLGAGAFGFCVLLGLCRKDTTLTYYTY